MRSSSEKGSFNKSWYLTINPPYLIASSLKLTVSNSFKSFSKVYFKIKTGPELYTGSPILCCGTIRKLDTDFWIGDQVVIGTNAEILQK